MKGIELFLIIVGFGFGACIGLLLYNFVVLPFFLFVRTICVYGKTALTYSYMDYFLDDISTEYDWDKKKYYLPEKLK